MLGVVGHWAEVLVPVLLGVIGFWLIITARRDVHLISGALLVLWGVLDFASRLALQ